MEDTTILRGIVGSTAYGLNHADSDIDRLGCYVEPTVRFHGLRLPVATRVRTEPSDYTEHEIGKLLTLLLKCNPTVTELLWLPDELYEIADEDGRYLIAIRGAFLSSKYVRDAYLGYATQQFRRLRDRGDGSFSSNTRKRTEKHARHLKRLCWQGYTLYSTGHLPIKVDDPEEYREFGRRVAEDPTVAEGMLASTEALFDAATPALPEEPNEPLVDAWLVALRARHFR